MKRLKHIVLLFLGIGILIAQDPPEEFQFHQSTLQAFYYFHSVTIDGVPVDSVDWVGAFNGDICVGARQWNTSECGGGVCDLPVMGYGGPQQPETEGYMNHGDIPTFKIYDASGNIYYDAIISGDITDYYGNTLTGAWSNLGFNDIDALNGYFDIGGCTDDNACNYDVDAIEDDGSCEYAVENYDCDGNCTAEVDECGVCGGDNSSCDDDDPYWYGTDDCPEGFEGSLDCIFGCEGFDFELFDSDNFGPICQTISDWGYYDDCLGQCSNNPCTDSMVYTIVDTCLECAEEGNCDQIAFGDGGGGEIIGCMDDSACNYNVDATNDDGSCLYNDCSGECGGSVEFDECGVCGGAGIADGACDCAGNVEDCAGECGGSAEVDECGVCGGYGIAEGTCDCAGNVEDCAGECGGDNSSCEDCAGVPDGNAVVDNCGVCGGDNTDCWFVDITTSVGDLGIIDSLSRIGMHIDAADGFNVIDDGIYESYEDELEADINFSNWIDFHFPHPEWETEIQDFIFNSRTDLKKDIRHLEEYTVADFDNNTSISVDGEIYHIQQEWDVIIDIDPNVSYDNNDVKLEFDFVNEILTTDQFTKIFFYRENSGNSEIEEITQDGGSGDCLSDYCIILDGYEFPSNFKIILGTDTVQPSTTIVSPLPNEIFGLENENFIIGLDIENPGMIGSLELFFEIGDDASDVISIAGPFEEVDFIDLEKNDYYTFLNERITADYIDSVNINIEIVDIAGGTVVLHSEYRSVLGPLTFSRNVSNFSLSSGWHLLSPPLSGDNFYVDLFDFPTFDCSDECYEIDGSETPNSGTGFYVKSNGESEFFTGNVLTEFSSTLKQGWNLAGNPLVNSVDINSVMITYDNYDYNWPEAAKYGIISPTPIIYDNGKGGHLGTSELSTAAGFWVHSFYDDVEISFIPSNISEEIETSNYWNLSLFAKEIGVGTDFDNSIGSEIVIGIHEDAYDTSIDGEDQGIFPLSEMSIFDSYTQLRSINNGDSLYRDIRSYHETSITWNFEGESIAPFATDGVSFSWEFSGNEDPYDYYLTIGEDIFVNMKSQPMSINFDFNNFSENMSIIAVLNEEYIGCTNPLADNHNKKPNGELCEGGTCLGGSHAQYCDILSLLLPEAAGIVETGEIELPIELVNPQNPQGTSIEGLQFVLEYDAEMIQLDTDDPVRLNENFEGLEDYEIIQEFCTDCIPSELSVSVYFTGLKEEFIDCGELNGVIICEDDVDWEDSLGNGVYDLGEDFIDIAPFNGLYDDESFTGEGDMLILSGIGLGGTGFTIISLSSVQINENGVYGSSCTINLGDYLTVSGKINYYKNAVPVSGGLVSTAYSTIETTTSNENGDFIIDSLITGTNYKLEIFKNEYEGNIDNYFDGLSAVDASRIARHSVGLYNFTEKEKLAANVIIDYRCENGEGISTGENEMECSYNWVPNIETGDASRVAKYAAGIIDTLGNLCDPHWVFLNPDDEIMIHNENCANLPNYSNFVRNYNTENLVSDTILTFNGIRLGDVTGNWTIASRQNEDYFVDNPMVDVELGQIVKLPLYLPNEIEIEGLDLTIQYDPEIFSLIGFNDNNSILEKSKYNTIINTEKMGLFTLVSYANSTPVNDNGLLGYIKFEVIGNSTRWSSISINEMKINDIQEGGFLVDGNFESSSIAHGFDFQISAVPEVFALNNNYPNPFNPSTNIKFELPNDGDVRIFIYDLKGSLIDELVNGYMEAGYHNLKWDGSYKASGVYFIQMIADNGNYIRMTKMMLIK